MSCAQLIGALILLSVYRVIMMADKSARRKFLQNKRQEDFEIYKKKSREDLDMMLGIWSGRYKLMDSLKFYEENRRRNELRILLNKEVPTSWEEILYPNLNEGLDEFKKTYYDNKETKHWRGRIYIVQNESSREAKRYTPYTLSEDVSKLASSSFMSHRHRINRIYINQTTKEE